MSLEILLEAALFLEQQQSQGEEPKVYGQLEQRLPEDASGVDRKISYHGSSGGAYRSGRDVSVVSVLSNGSYSSTGPTELISSHKQLTTASSAVGASVIQRLGPATLRGSSNGSRGSTAASLYSYHQDEARSPSPACNGKERSSSPPMIGANTSGINGNNPSVVRKVYPSSPSTSLDSLEQHPHGAQSQYGSGGNSYRVDDVASRSHRLEEALLRASNPRRSPTTTSSSSSSSSSTHLAHNAAVSFHPSSTATTSAGSATGRISASDELQELKKRSGAGTREVHNKLEKNRRAHLRECFEVLRKHLPAVDDKKLSNLGILKSALRYIQTLKRKEREYEHTMERLAREKIAAQQRLATLRKEVSTIPGCSADAGLLDLGSVLPVLQQSHQQPPTHLEHSQSATSSHLTFANVQAHNLREENKLGSNHASSSHKSGGQRDDPDQEDRESHSTSTASERGDLSDHDDDDDKSFQEAFARQRVNQHRSETTTSSSSLPDFQRRSPVAASNGRALSPSPYGAEPSRGLKRSYADEEATPTSVISSVAPPLPAVREENSRPHIKYVRAATSVGTSGTSGQPTFLTMAAAPAGAHVLELSTSSTPATSADVKLENGSAAGAPLYAVRQPIAFTTATTANGLSAHVQLGPQVLSTHHPHAASAAAVQLFGPSLKVLAPSSMAGVRVITTDGASSSIQPLVAVHPSSSVSGTKSGEEVASSVLNGTTASTGSFCIPAGVVIPSLVALPPETVSTGSVSSVTGTTVSSSAASFEQLAPPARSSGVSQLKHAPTISSSSTVLSLPNGLLKGAVNRSIAIQPSTTTGVTHVMTPLGVTTRSLPLVTSMAVMQPAKHVAHLLTNSTLEKVAVAAPLLKTGPGLQTIIAGGQYLTSPALGGRHVIKPLVVVAAPAPTQPSSSPPASTSSSPAVSAPVATATPPTQRESTVTAISTHSVSSTTSTHSRSSPSPPSKSS